ncbi:MAG: FAD-dependent oxidoreductase, partial [Clostridia bacterium]
MELYRKGDIESAAKVIMEVNPMPALTSRVCAHFCMEGCNRNAYDESVNIGAVERNIGDYIFENYQKFMVAPTVLNGKKISIVGSGPSGLTAAYYLRQSGYDVTIYEKKKEAGGCLMYAIPAYRLPKDLVRKFISILVEIGIVIKCDVEVGKDISIDEIYKKSDSVMVDTGTWQRPLIGLKGEELTRFGLDFLVDINEYIGKDFGDKVVVVGGGNVAMDVAITAKRLGVKDVKMLCLEDREHMPANLEEIERALEENIEILNMWGPKEVLKTGEKVSGISFKKCLQTLDINGKFSPKYDEEDILTLDADIIIMAIGQRADLSFLEGAYKLESFRGRIVATNNNATTVEGIFASGDVTTGPATVIKAIAEGKKTAIGINEYCGGGKLIVETVEMNRKKSDMLTFDSNCYCNNIQNKQVLIDTNQRGLEIEDLQPLSNNEVQSEINRCFNCGCLAVNPSDTANMLLALDAKFVTNYRTLTAVELLTKKTKINEVLKKGEIITEIVVPNTSDNTIAEYNKYRTRKS